MTNFGVIFGVVFALNVALSFRSSDYYKKWKKPSGGVAGGIEDSDAGSAETKQKHANLLQKYLLVYLLATFSDWLQGPYVYALYAKYGFEQNEIAQLFVAGFGSSMIFGSFVGGMADWGGRRAFVIIFAITYAASCVTKRKLRSPTSHAMLRWTNRGRESVDCRPAVADFLRRYCPIHFLVRVE